MVGFHPNVSTPVLYCCRRPVLYCCRRTRLRRWRNKRRRWEFRHHSRHLRHYRDGRFRDHYPNWNSLADRAVAWGAGKSVGPAIFASRQTIANAFIEVWVAIVSPHSKRSPRFCSLIRREENNGFWEKSMSALFTSRSAHAPQRRREARDRSLNGTGLTMQAAPGPYPLHSPPPLPRYLL
jgi:hypothetical protein